MAGKKSKKTSLLKTRSKKLIKTSRPHSNAVYKSVRIELSDSQEDICVVRGSFSKRFGLKPLVYVYTREIRSVGTILSIKLTDDSCASSESIKDLSLLKNAYIAIGCRYGLHEKIIKAKVVKVTGILVGTPPGTNGLPPVDE